MNVAHFILGLQIITFGFQMWTFYLIWKTQKTLDRILNPTTVGAGVRFQGKSKYPPFDPKYDPNVANPSFDARRRPPM